MPGRRRSAARLAGRNGEIWRAYVNGLTQDAIADKFGISQQRVSQIVHDVRSSIPDRVRGEVVDRQVELLERLQGEAIELWEKPPIPAYSNGRPILDEDGQAVEDHTYRMRALDAVLKIVDRHADMLGLKAPTKTEVEMTAQVSMPPEVAGRIQAARMRVGRVEKRLRDQPEDVA